MTMSEITAHDVATCGTTADVTTSGITAHDVTVAVTDRTILEDVALTVRPGELLALVGPNGAGKTTLLRVLCGDLTPTSGVVTLDGRPIGQYRAVELARQRAVLPQRSTIEFAFTAREVVEMGRAPHAGTPAEEHDDDVIDAALEATDSAHLAGREYRNLSGGEQARVNLARVIAQDCCYVLLDEPTAALDLRHQEQVMGLAADLAATGHGVVVVVHDLNLAAAYATHVALLVDGFLAALDDPTVVLQAEQLSAAYRYPVAVHTHPTRGCPLVVADGPIRPDPSGDRP